MTGKAIAFRLTLAVVCMGVFLYQATVQSSPGQSPAKEQIIRISASMFEFKPSEITLKKDVPVVFELISQDRHHGFSLPEFHLRADVMPGTVERLRFMPRKIGNFTFLCDTFCGDRHEEMSGTIRVVE
jgi:cytochrome c oxidase subunit II